MLENQKEIDDFNRMRIGDPAIIKQNRSISVICFLFRAGVLLTLLLLMTAPFYIGVFRIFNSLNIFNLMILFVCGFINIIQSMSLLVAEFSIFRKIFLTEGQANEYI